ncbi:MAG TPA: nitroreductase family protein [Actinomycetota bacterium]|jgi:nitroreductase
MAVDTPQPVPVGDDAPILEVMRTMRAMRRLKPDPVPRELIEELIEAATWAPSGGNLQGFSFVVVDDRDVIARLAPIWRKTAGWYIAMQDQPPPHMAQEQLNALIAALRFQAEHFPEIPALIICCYELRSSVQRQVKSWRRVLGAYRGLPWRDALTTLHHLPRFIRRGEAASIYPGVQNLLLTARAKGLGATLTTWHLAFEDEVRAVLGIPRHVHTYALVPIGWPRGRLGTVVRRPAREAIHWNRW